MRAGDRRGDFAEGVIRIKKKQGEFGGQWLRRRNRNRGENDEMEGPAYIRGKYIPQTGGAAEEAWIRRETGRMRSPADQREASGGRRRRGRACLGKEARRKVRGSGGLQERQSRQKRGSGGLQGRQSRQKRGSGGLQGRQSRQKPGSGELQKRQSRQKPGSVRSLWESIAIFRKS